MSSVQQAVMAGQYPAAKARRKPKGPSEAEMAMARQMLRADKRRSKARFTDARGVVQPAFAGRKLFDGKGSYWPFPASGGVLGGLEVGEAVGIDFLKALRSNPEDFALRESLVHAVDSIAWRIAGLGGWSESGSVRGENEEEIKSLLFQLHGLLRVIIDWTTASVRRYGDALDWVTPEELDQRIQAGLAKGVAA